MSHKPTILFVPGAWHQAIVWDNVTSLLESQQFKCVAIALPTSTSDPSLSLKDDVEAVRNSILEETTKGKDVVVVTHSYGGAVGASAIRGLTRPRDSEGHPEPNNLGHVIGLILIASGFMITGKNFIEGFNGTPPPIWNLNPETGFTDLIVDQRQLFYHDLPLEEGNLWVEKLQKFSTKALTEGGLEYGYSGWKDVPVWYLGTVEDKALPVEVQRMWVKENIDAGVDITLREIESSHSPMLSKPKETADLILEAVSKFVK